MGLFKKREDAAAEHAESAPEERKAARRRPKREAHAFNQVPPWEMNEELADRIAMRAYGDEDKDGKPDIPAAPFPGF